MQMLASLARSQLVIIDMQAKLAKAMPPDGMQAALKQCEHLIQAARLLTAPIIVTEHYPQGLGETFPALKQHFEQDSTLAVIEKTAFSACGAPQFNQQLNRDTPQIILAGMEAHICVLQTALDLLQANKQVFVVEDAILSRQATHKANAIARMREAGCVITNTESVLFEWLGNAQHPAFKAISALIK